MKILDFSLLQPASCLRSNEGILSPGTFTEISGIFLEYGAN
jgi:hypothetical protein